MPGVSVALDWWPPEPDEPIGEDRARELVAALRPIVGSVVDEAEADLREMIGPQGKVARGSAPASYFARVRFGPEMRSLCLGTVYELHNGDARQNSIQLLRDGTVTWWPGRRG